MRLKIDVWITANAGRNEVIGWRDGRLKIKVKAPAVEGKANEELLRFLAERLQVRRREIGIERGETAKSKLIWVEGIDQAQFFERLQLTPPEPKIAAGDRRR